MLEVEELANKPGNPSEFALQLIRAGLTTAVLGLVHPAKFKLRGLTVFPSAFIAAIASGKLSAQLPTTPEVPQLVLAGNSPVLGSLVVNSEEVETRTLSSPTK